VTFSHDLGVLWLSNYSYPNLVLQSLDENRVVFRDITGKFLKENQANLDGVDSFTYGAELMSQTPRLLPDGRFSVRLEDIESISKDGRVVWQGRGVSLHLDGSRSEAVEQQRQSSESVWPIRSVHYQD
jgi:hypothetical protein